MKHPPTTEITVRLPRWVTDVVDFDRVYPDDESRMRLAIELARCNVERETGGPFGAAVFERLSGRLVSVGTNSVLRSRNSSAHAEMVAFMMAQAAVGCYTLTGPGMVEHEVFSSCEPCAMCLGGVLWSGVTRLVFAATREDAHRLDFDEGPVFPESYEYLEDRGISIVRGLLRDEANEVFEIYRERGGLIYNG